MSKGNKRGKKKQNKNGSQIQNKSTYDMQKKIIKDNVLQKVQKAFEVLNPSPFDKQGDEKGCIVRRHSRA